MCLGYLLFVFQVFHDMEHHSKEQADEKHSSLIQKRKPSVYGEK